MADPPDAFIGADQQPVGVIDGPVTEAAVDAFIEHVHARFTAADPSVRSELIYAGPPAPSQLVAHARRHGVRLRSLIEYQGLLDLRPLAEAQQERLADARRVVRRRLRGADGRRVQGRRGSVVGDEAVPVRAGGTGRVRAGDAAGGGGGASAAAGEGRRGVKASSLGALNDVRA